MDWRTPTGQWKDTAARTLMLKLAESLEDLDDVQNFYANFDISEEEMEKLA